MPEVLTNRFKSQDWKEGLYLGEQFRRDKQVCGDKRCEQCGSWFTWDSQYKMKYVAQANWREGKLIGEPIHCGSEFCQDWRHRELTVPNVHKQKKEEKTLKMFKGLKKLGLVC